MVNRVASSGGRPYSKPSASKRRDETMNIPRRQSISDAPLSPTEFSILLVLHRTSVEQLAEAIGENRVQVSYVISLKRTNGPVIERIRRKLAERFGFEYEVMWGKEENKEGD
jgi:hypothetical protein